MSLRRCGSIAGACAAAIALAPGIADAGTDDIVGRPLVLAADQVAVDITIESNLAPDQIALPLSIAPDLWWGISSRLTIGIVHSSPSVDQVAPGASFCVLNGDAAGSCTQLYRGSGLDARWSLVDDGTFAIAPRARMLVRDTDPWKPAATIGALARWHRGRFAIVGDPYAQIGLGNNTLGNYSAVVVPLYLEVQPTERWMIALQTGFQSDLHVIDDGWHVPAGVLTTVRATTAIDVGAELGFATVLGPQNDLKQRAVFLTGGWHTGS